MTIKTENPWKGLNFYVEGEILYGRDLEIERLSQYIINNTQTVLYGKSGIGKSSILNAGIFPRARACGLRPVSIRFDHQCKTSYIEQIRTAVCDAGVTATEVVPIIDPEKETIWEFLHRHIFKDENGEEIPLLLAIDQFEEIFTLQPNEKVKLRFFSELADLLNDVTPQYILDATTKTESQHTEQEKPLVTNLEDLNLDLEESSANGMPEYVQLPKYHIVLTLREDFLSYLERYTAYIPVMRTNRFALQPINEEQAAEIIMKPCPGLVQKDVAELIIQKVTGRKDFQLDGTPEIEVDAAILSLYLSRLYEKKAENEGITANLVNQFSDDIIKDFYEDSIRDIPSTTVNYLEDVLITSEGRRNNVSVADLLAKGISQADIRTLTFERKLLRQFSYGGDMRIEYIHDILCRVIRSRREIRKQLRLQEEEKQRLLAEEKAKRQRLLENAQRIRCQNRKRTVFFGSIIFSLLLIALIIYFLRFHVYENNFAYYEIKNGYIEGVESFDLSDAMCEVTPLYYRLKHKGTNTHISEIEIKSSNNKLPHSPRLKVIEIGTCAETDKKGTQFSAMLSQVARVQISEDKNQRIIKEEYVDESGNILFELNYSYVNAREAWVHFLSAQGQSLIVRDSGVEQAKLSWDEQGRLVGITYYDYNGVCKEIEPGVGGYLWVRGANNSVCQYILNEYSQPTRQSLHHYNTVYSREVNDSLITCYANSMEISDTTALSDAEPAKGPLGFVKTIRTAGHEYLYVNLDGEPSAELITIRDDRGNILEQRIEGHVPIGMPAQYKYAYNSDGFILSKCLLNADNTPFGLSDNDIYLWKWNYDKEGQLTLEERINTRNVVVYQRKVIRQQNLLIEETKDITKPLPFVKRVDSIKGNTTVTAFFAENDRRINGKWFSNGTDSILVFHKMERTVKDNVTTSSYYKCSGDSVLPLETISKDNTITSYFRKETTTDGNGNISKYRIYDVQGKIIKSMMYFFQNGQNIGRAVCGIDGTPVRCPNWEEEGYGYYKIYVSTNNDRNYATILPVNEWDDNSVLYDGLSSSYWETKYLDFKGLSFIYQNTQYFITNTYHQMIFVAPQNLSGKSIPYLHILNRESSLYKVGLRDGDRIIACGKWCFGMSNVTLNREWEKTGSQPIGLTVLRPNKKKGYLQIQTTVPKSSETDIMAEYHILTLTKTEYELIQQQNRK